MSNIDELKSKVNKVLKDREDGKAKERQKETELKEKATKELPTSLGFLEKSITHLVKTNVDLLDKKAGQDLKELSNLVKTQKEELQETLDNIQNNERGIADEIKHETKVRIDNLSKIEKEINDKNTELKERVIAARVDITRKIRTLDEKRGEELSSILVGVKKELVTIQDELKKRIDEKQLEPHRLQDHVDTVAKGSQVNRLVAGRVNDFVDDLHAHNPNPIYKKVEEMMSNAMQSRGDGNGVNLGVRQDGGQYVNQINEITFVGGTVTDKGSGRVDVDVMVPDIEDGTAQGQVLFWDATANAWAHTETTEMEWDDVNKQLNLNFTNGAIPFQDANGLTTDNANFNYTDATNTLYVNLLQTTALELTGWTAGSVAFMGAAGYLAEDNANFFWDDTLNRLGIGTATPSEAIDVTDGTNHLLYKPSTSKLTISGTNANLTQSPGLELKFNGDSNLAFSFFAYGHDNVSLAFDAWWNGTSWISSDLGSNFAIYKTQDHLTIGFNSNVTAGNALPGGFNLTGGARFSKTGSLGIGTSPTAKLHVAGDVLFQNGTDSTTAFQVLDADGGTPVFNVDTTNERVIVGAASSDAPLSVVVPGAAAGRMFQLEVTGGNKMRINYGAGGTELEFYFASNLLPGSLMQTWKNDGGIKFRSIANSVTAWQFLNSSSSPFVTIDSVNERAGFGVADPDTKVEVFNAGTQLKLSFDATDFATFAVDTNQDLTITPSGTGQIKLVPTTDSTDFFQVLDADGGVPVFNVDSTNERVGVGIAAPLERIHSLTAGFNNYARIEEDDGSHIAGVHLRSGIYDTKINQLGAAFSINVESQSNAITIDQNGLVGIGLAAAGARLEILDTTDPQLRLTHTDGVDEADFYVDGSGDLFITPSSGNLWIGNGGDVDYVLGFYGNTTQGAIIWDEDNGYFSISGNDLTNNTRIEADGTLSFHGTATVWDDQQVSLGSVGFGASAPTVRAYMSSEVLGFANNQSNSITFTVQFSHKIIDGSTTEFHLHTVDPNNISGNVRWQLTVSYASIGGTFGAASTTTVTQAVGALDLHELFNITDTFTASTGISGIALCSLTRLGSDGADTYNGEIYLTALDSHFEIDTVGSRQETSK